MVVMSFSRPILMPLLACLSLAACGDPLANVERLSDVPVAPGVADAALAAAPAEAGDAPGFLGRLLSGEASASVATPSVGAGEVAPGTVLPYGQIASVCGITGSALGTEVGQQAGFTLYDSSPNSIAPRTHYITGLDGGCARQFTAALALFGDLPTHEMIRYQPTNAAIPYSATDTAYEEIKASYCGVSAGQPCGGRINRLAGRMAFITVYETFGTNPAWNEILLYDGEVVAISAKSS